MDVRISTDLEMPAIDAIHRSAFGQAHGDEIVDLVRKLLFDQTGQPILSLVAECDGAMVGHVLFTAVTLHPDDHGRKAQILAPLAVAAEFQGRGIGAALVRAGLNRLSAAAVDLVFVLGDPGYYGRFGFQPASALGYEASYPIPPKNAEAWQVIALRNIAFDGRVRRVRCAAALDDPRHWRE